MAFTANALICASIDAINRAMRTTVVIDDDLLAAAQAFAGPRDKSALLRLALTRYIESEAARRLALMGGSDPDAAAGPRRRTDTA